MAHIVRSPRFITTNPSSTPYGVGPGKYTRDLVDGRFRPGYAPFSVLQKRFDDSLSAVPGPGAYDPSQGKEPLAKRRQMSSLASTSERFEEIRKKRDPGPGNYESKLDWVKPSFRIGGTVKETTRLDDALSPFTTAPSIPTQKQSYGYIDGPRGRLQMKRPPVEGYTGRGIDAPGPGEYQVMEISHNANFNDAHNRNYTIMRSPRSTSNKTIAPGPGAYTPQRPREYDKLALPSTSFVSQTSRNIIFDPKTPGPGSYHVMGNIKKEFPEDHVQSFGVIASRGIGDDSRKGGGIRGRGLLGTGKSASEIGYSVPGPGAYEEPRLLIPKPPSMHPFSQTSSRFTSSTTEVPGPGNYNPIRPDSPSFTTTHPTCANTTSSAFGASSMRFDPNQAAVGIQGGAKASFVMGGRNGVPGPGAYTHEDALVTVFRRRHPTSSFTSGTSRFYTSETLPPGPGAYKTKDSSIRFEPQLTLTGEIHPSSVFIGPPRDKQVAGMIGIGDGAGGGFTFGKNGMNSSGIVVPGPGAYTPDLISAQSSIGVKSTGFQSTQSRFGDRLADIPGPGAYEVQPPELIKRSFNRTITSS